MQKKCSIACAVLLAGTSTVGYAQSSSDAGVATSSPQLEEIVVTAQRREEKLQNVPVSVSVASAATLESAGVTNIQALTKVSPSLNINPGQGPVEVFIRGIGNKNDAAGNEGSAAVYVDGVYVARPTPELFAFRGVERVEVLKGPQGTLFGRNSSAGLVNIITRTPTDVPTMEASLGYGNYDTVDTSAYVSGGLAPNVAVGVTGFYSVQNRGWGRNVTLNEKVGFGRRWGGRVKLVADVTDTTKVTLSADYLKAYTNRAFDLPPGRTSGNPPYLPPMVYAATGIYDTDADTPYYFRTKSYSGMARIEQDLSFARLVSISGYRKTTSYNAADGDAGPVPSFQYQLDNRSEQFSEELQLLSRAGSPITWVAGLYYLDSKDGYYPVSFQGSDFGPGLTVNLFGESKVKSYAGFGQATAQIANNLNLTIGARYTVDKSKVFGFTTVGLVGPDPAHPVIGSTEIVRNPDVVGSKTFKKLTWRGALDYKLADDAMIYASVSRGYKAGVFETLPANAVPINPETVDAYEIGFKSEMLDRRVRINGSLFWSDIKNPQVSFIRQTFVALANAGSARSRGAELELELAATKDLRLRFSGTYLDAKYRSFTGAPFNAPNTDLITGPSGLPTVPGCVDPATVNTNPANGGNVDFCQGDASGHRLPRAPKFAFSTGFDYRIPLGADAIELSSNVSYNDGFFWEPQNTTRQKSYFLVDAQIAYAIDDGKVRIRGWGRNLTRTKYYANLYEQAGATGAVGQAGAPRTYGVAVDFKF
ncbi:TonB-dependent receptor [Novosphingobium colocasiae]|uniref:TonB-dependent receptor n=2 Tax=Novosphingobium colocasiae TaxID=1256513 RepID=A0A918PNT4_9SPHN|nr:TonB-dependent receptor [Novosphingobium colocasiae]